MMIVPAGVKVHVALGYADMEKGPRRARDHRPRDGLAHGLGKTAPPDPVQADAKGLQRVPNRVLQIQKLALQIAPVRQQ